MIVPTRSVLCFRPDYWLPPLSSKRPLEGAEIRASARQPREPLLHWPAGGVCLDCIIKGPAACSATSEASVPGALQEGPVPRFTSSLPPDLCFPGWKEPGWWGAERGPADQCRGAGVQGRSPSPGSCRWGRRMHQGGGSLRVQSTAPVLLCPRLVGGHWVTPTSSWPCKMRGQPKRVARGPGKAAQGSRVCAKKLEGSFLLGRQKSAVGTTQNWGLRAPPNGFKPKGESQRSRSSNKRPGGFHSASSCHSGTSGLRECR